MRYLTSFILPLSSTIFLSRVTANIATNDAQSILRSVIDLEAGGEGDWTICGPKGCMPALTVCGKYGCVATKDIQITSAKSDSIQQNLDERTSARAKHEQQPLSGEDTGSLPHMMPDHCCSTPEDHGPLTAPTITDLKLSEVARATAASPSDCFPEMCSQNPACPGCRTAVATAVAMVKNATDPADHGAQLQTLLQHMGSLVQKITASPNFKAEL